MSEVHASVYSPNVPGVASAPWLDILVQDITEDAPRPGYPEQDSWARVSVEEIRERTTALDVPINNIPRIVYILELPEGADAVSPERKAFLQSPEAQHLLLPAVEPIIIGSRDPGTGLLLQVPNEHFRQSIADGYSVFDQHHQPLAGQSLHIRQLLSLVLPGQAEGERAKLLGMPTNVGVLPRHGFAPVTEVIAVSKTPEGEIIVLADGRPAPGGGQGHPVLGTISTFGSALDVRGGVYSPAAAGERGFKEKVGDPDVDMSEYSPTLFSVEHPPWGAATLHTGLEVTPMLVLLPYDRRMRVARHIPLKREDIEGQGPTWFKRGQLVEEDQKIQAAYSESGGAAHLPRRLVGSVAADHMRRSVEAVSSSM